MALRSADSSETASVQLLFLGEGKITEEVVQNIRSWKHSGFSVDQSVRLEELNSLIYLDPLNWDFARRDTFALFAKDSHRATIGTLDAAILASAKLAGGTRLLCFDQTLKALARSEGLDVFPSIDREGKRLLSRLKARGSRGF